MYIYRLFVKQFILYLSCENDEICDMFSYMFNIS